MAGTRVIGLKLVRYWFVVVLHCYWEMQEGIGSGSGYSKQVDEAGTEIHAVRGDANIETGEVTARDGGAGSAV